MVRDDPSRVMVIDILLERFIRQDNSTPDGIENCPGQNIRNFTGT